VKNKRWGCVVTVSSDDISSVQGPRYRSRFTHDAMATAGKPWRENKGPVTSIANEIRRNLDNYTSDQSECVLHALRHAFMHINLNGSERPALARSMR
jgi:hypothetical protein